MIEIKELKKNYGNICAVKSLDFNVKKGEKLGFLGPNGAGKSTTMNMITGHIPFNSGSIKVNGYDLLENPKKVKKMIGYLPENPPLYVEMTIEEFLNFVCNLKKVDRNKKKKHMTDIMELVSLGHVKDRLIKNLSKGYKQRVGIAQAMIGDPEILILDEPTVGLDPAQIIEIRNLIKSLDHTVILSSHILPEISAVCERVVIINQGSSVAVDTPENLSNYIENNLKLTVTVIGSDREGADIISKIDGVIKIESILTSDKNSVKYEIEYNKNFDIRKDLSISLVKSGFPIIELKQVNISLEDVFMKLLKNEEGGNVK